MKYIVEIAKEYEEYFKGILICGIAEGKFAVDVIAKEDLEELTSDYINEHFGDLQDDAYDKGYAQCQDDYGDALKHAKDTAYKKGLEDAWEAARKILQMYDFTVFGLEHDGVFESPLNEGQQMTPQEAIEKLKAYEEKQKDKIEVGDEVNWLGDCFIVTRIFQPHNMKEQCDGIDDDGCVYHDVLMNDLEKTGRHFDIASILEDMRND